MNSGDTAWVLIASALVLLMTIPGLAFFYGGLVRRKNVLSILMQCFIIVCVISLQWMLFGYSLAFGPAFHGIIGNLDWIGLSRRRSVAEPGLFQDDSAFRLYDLSGHVCHHYAGLDHRRLCGKGEVFRFSALHHFMGNLCL